MSAVALDEAELSARLSRFHWGNSVASPPPEPGPTHPWDLVDILQAAGPAPEATLLRRTDGAGLFYPGVINALFAPYESAKTFVALLTCLQVMEQGGTALYVDFESSPRAIANRLRALGGLGLAESFGYIRPTLPVDHDRLAAALDRLDPTVVIVDAAAEAMVTHDFDENSNADYMRFSRLLLEPLEERGCGVVLLDHLGHSGEKPRGASAKMAAVHGSALRIEVETPFRPGHNDGMARVFVAKDREGQVRKVSTAETLVAYLHLITDRDSGVLRVELEPPAGPVAITPNHSVERLSSSVAAALKQRAEERR